HDGGEEGVAEAAREAGEALLERGGEQERQQHLDPGQDHPELLEQLHQLPVEALGLALLVGHAPFTSCSGDFSVAGSRYEPAMVLLERGRSWGRSTSPARP